MAIFRLHETTQFSGFAGITFGLLIATLGGALLLLFGLWIYQLSTFSQDGNNRVFRANQLILINGEGEIRTDGLVIRKGMGKKPIAVLADGGNLRAGHYQAISWEMVGLTDDLELALVWSSTLAPGPTRFHLITPAERSASGVELQGVPEWGGQIGRLGLLIKGTLSQPLVIRKLMLQALAGGLPALPLAAGWLYEEPWSPRSINFHAGTTRGFLLTPVSVVALWLGLSSLLFMAITRFSSVGPLWSGIAILVLTGWLLLDLRWQWQLLVRLEETYHTSDRPALASRARSLPDVPFMEAIHRVRQALPATPTRLFILTEDPGGFMALRLRYHLLPHRGYAGLSQLPDPVTVAAGDAILVLSSLTGIRYDGYAQQLLSAGGKTLAAEMVLEVPGFGNLYRAKGGVSR